MPFIFSSLFWGVMLLLLGASMILRAVFNLDIPVFRIIFALVIIYFGVKLLIGRHAFKSSDNYTMFRNTSSKISDLGEDYSIIFGKSNIDLTQVDLSTSVQKTSVDIIFGSANILIDPDIPMKINISTIFADCKLPQRNINFFGDSEYKTPSYVAGENFLELNIDVIFGNAVVIAKVSDE